MDLEDLPEAVRVAADGMRLAAAWQSVGDGKEGRLAVAVLPAAGVRETVVGSRETTTLLTREGTVLHRERLVLGRAGSGVEVRLGSGATLWSASVGGQSVRHLERDGLVVVPVALGTAAGTEVEVVVVERQAIGEGRTRVGITLPELMAPVLEHRWRLLLPEEHRYRFAGGSLTPVPEVGSVARQEYVETLAASGTGQIWGRVTDDRNEALPGVTVTVSSRAGSRAVVSDVEGAYLISHLPADSYQVSFRLDGFTTSEAKVGVTSGFAHRLDTVLRAGRFEEEITVSANTAIISRSPEVSTTIPPDPFKGVTDSPRSTPQTPRKEKKVEQVARTEFGGELANLRQGLVGGVRPVPVAIPSSGKSLLMAGALPPATVRVELDVKRKR
ncbi:MAG: carboxypeptidase-like regulatory domain-containing protein [Thermoanaerobaculaceae bacterium]